MSRAPPRANRRRPSADRGVEKFRRSVSRDDRRRPLALAPPEPPVQAHAGQNEVMLYVDRLAFAQGATGKIVILPGQIDEEDFPLDAQPRRDPVFGTDPCRPACGVFPLLEPDEGREQFPDPRTLAGPQAAAGHIDKEAAGGTQGVADPSPSRPKRADP